jgi:hypothetical protein
MRPVAWRERACGVDICHPEPARRGGSDELSEDAGLPAPARADDLREPSTWDPSTGEESVELRDTGREGGGEGKGSRRVPTECELMDG